MATGVLLKSLSNGVVFTSTSVGLHVAAGRLVYVYHRGTTTQVQVYSDSALTSTLAQPLLTDSSGGIPGYVASETSIDFVDSALGEPSRAPAEPIAIGDLVLYAPAPTGVGATDIANFTAAITAAAATSGTVVLHQGTYVLPTTTPITFDPKFVSIQGGAQTVLDFSGSTSSAAFTLGGTIGSHEPRFPFANLTISGPTASNTTVDGVHLGGTSLFAPHCSFRNVRWIGFQNQVYNDSNVWSSRYYSCHWENAQTAAYTFNPAATNTGEDINFYGGVFYNAPQELILLNAAGVDLAFYGTSFDYSGRAINQNQGHILCVGCHFEADNARLATGAHEYILMSRNSLTDLPLLELVGCTYYPLWTTRQAHITLSGSQGSSQLRVSGGQVTTGGSFTLRTFVQDTGTNPADVEITGLRYSEPNTNGPLYFTNAAGSYAINNATTGSAASFHEGINTNGVVSGQSLTTPAAPVVTQAGTPGSTSYWYKWVAAILLGGGNANETPPSTATQTTTGNATLNGTNYNVVAGSPVPGATSYLLLKSTDGTTYHLLASGLAKPSYNDQGASTSAYTAATVNPTPVGTFGGINFPGIGTNHGGGIGFGSSPAVYSDNGNRLKIVAHNNNIIMVPGGEGVGTGQITTATTGTTFTAAVVHARTTQTLNANGAVTINANLGDIAAITLNANATSSSISNGQTGQVLTVEWIQGTGNNTYVWPAACKFAGATPLPSTVAGSVDSVTFEYNGTVWVETSRAVASTSAPQAINVKTYGAACAIGTDDHVAVQAAIDAAVVSNLPVLIPAPTTVGNNGNGCALIVHPGTRLVGAGIGGNVFSDTDPTLPPRGGFLQLAAGANCDVIQSDYFNALETGTTLNGAQATNTGTLTVNGTPAPLASGSTNWFPTSGTLAVAGLTLAYTGVTITTGQVTAFTGITGGNSTVQGSGTVVMLAQDAHEVPSRLTIEDLVVDGNLAANASGRGLAIYAMDYMVRGLVVQRCAGDGWFSDADHTAGYDHEADISHFRATDNGGNGINWQGTHDSIFVNGFAARNGLSGIVEGSFAGALNFTNVHNWGNSAYNWDMQSQHASHVNCQSDGAVAVSGALAGAGIRLGASYVQWKGGQIYGSGVAGEALVQVGNGAGSALTVQGCDFDCDWFGIGLGAVPLLYADDGFLTARTNKFRGSFLASTNTRFVAYAGPLISGAQSGTSGTLTFATGSLARLPASGSIYVAASGTLMSIAYTGKTSSPDTLTGCTGGSAVTIPNGTRAFYTSAISVATGFETWLFDPSDGANVGLFQIGSLGDGNLSTVFDGRNVISYSGAVIIKQPQTQSLTLAANGAVTIDASKSQAFRLALQANATSMTINNPTTNQVLTIKAIQDGTGGRTYAYPANCRFVGGSAPSDTTLNHETSVTFRYNGSLWIEECRSVSVPVT